MEVGIKSLSGTGLASEFGAWDFMETAAARGAAPPRE